MHRCGAKLGFSYDQVNGFIEGGQPTDELSAIIGNIEARGLGDFIKVDYRIIRGLAYYTQEDSTLKEKNDLLAGCTARC